MKSAILEKIERTLNGPLDQEALVVYLLVETRKYLELTNGHQRLPKLWLFCNWALHSQLSGPPAQQIVADVDGYLQKSIGKMMPESDIQAFERILNLGDFRSELRAFLQSENLPTNVCDDDQRWRSLLSVYARIIEDCPLTVTGAANATVLIDQMVVSFMDTGAASGLTPQTVDFFPMDWDFFKARTKRGTLRLRPDGELAGSTLEWK